MDRDGELAAFVIALVKRRGGKVHIKASEIEDAVLSTDEVHVDKRCDGSYDIRLTSSKGGRF